MTFHFKQSDEDYQDGEVRQKHVCTGKHLEITHKQSFFPPVSLHASLSHSVQSMSPPHVLQ